MRAAAMILLLLLASSVSAEPAVHQRGLLLLENYTPQLEKFKSLFEAHLPSESSSSPPLTSSPPSPPPPSTTPTPPVLLQRPSNPLPDSPEGSGKMVVAPQPTGVSVARLSGFVLVIVLANRDGMCFIQNFGVVDSSVQVMGEGTSAAVSGEFAAVGECAAGATGFGFAYVQSTVLAQAQRNGDECNSSVTSSGGSGSTIFGSGISVGTKSNVSGSAGCNDDKPATQQPSGTEQPSSPGAGLPSPVSPVSPPSSPTSAKKGKKSKKSKGRGRKFRLFRGRL